MFESNSVEEDDIAFLNEQESVYNTKQNMVIKKNQGRYGFKNTNKTIKRNGIVDHHNKKGYTDSSSLEVMDSFEIRINEEFKAKSNSASICDEEEKKEQKKK